MKGILVHTDFGYQVQYNIGQDSKYLANFNNKIVRLPLHPDSVFVEYPNHSFEGKEVEFEIVERTADCGWHGVFHTKYADIIKPKKKITTKVIKVNKPMPEHIKKSIERKQEWMRSVSEGTVSLGSKECIDNAIRDRDAFQEKRKKEINDAEWVAIFYKFKAEIWPRTKANSFHFMDWLKDNYSAPIENKL